MYKFYLEQGTLFVLAPRNTKPLEEFIINGQNGRDLHK
jgi:hypothetical protein